MTDTVSREITVRNPGLPSPILRNILNLAHWYSPQIFGGFIRISRRPLLTKDLISSFFHWLTSFKNLTKISEPKQIDFYLSTVSWPSDENSYLLQPKTMLMKAVREKQHSKFMCHKSKTMSWCYDAEILHRTEENLLRVATSDTSHIRHSHYINC